MNADNPPRPPIIADRVEAWLGVLGRLSVIAGFVLGVLGNPTGWALLAFGVLLLVAYLRRVGRRLGIEKQDRRILRRWLGNGALYRSLLTIRHGDDRTIL